MLWHAYSLGPKPEVNQQRSEVLASRVLRSHGPQLKQFQRDAESRCGRMSGKMYMAPNSHLLPSDLYQRERNKHHFMIYDLENTNVSFEFKTVEGLQVITCLSFHLRGSLKETPRASLIFHTCCDGNAWSQVGS